MSTPTRDRILTAARAHLEEHGYHGAGLEDLARAAGVSRQAVYLHFGSKAGLLVALVDHVDRVENLEKHMARYFKARTALEALDAAIDLQATYTPKILRIAQVLDAARRTDPDADAAWQDRMAGRLAHARELATRLKREGFLAQGWTVNDAADLYWTLSSIQTFESLVVARGWTPEKYARHLKKVMRKAFTTPK